MWPLFFQREAEDAQYRVVRKAEDLAGAALGLHGRGPQGPGRDRPRGLRLRQQDGAQAQQPDHGGEGGSGGAIGQTAQKPETLILVSKVNCDI